MKRYGYLVTLVGLCASVACNLLVEDNPKFSGTDDDQGDPDSGSPSKPPLEPNWLVIGTIGDAADADVDPLGPGLLLAGGGANVDVAFQWQSTLIQGGDIVVLHGGDDPQIGDYLDYLFANIGGADSVQTVELPPDSPAVQEPWVLWTIEHAEAVLIVGAEPSALFWKDTPIEAAIMHAWDRGAVIGGVDAGLSVVGEFSFPSSFVDGEAPLSSAEALADPYVPSLVLQRDYLSFEPLERVVLEARFANEDRMGRLLALAARVLEDNWSKDIVGLGIDEDTAMVIGPDGVGKVYGNGHVYSFRADKRADTCDPQTPLSFGPLMMYRLAAGDTATWPNAETAVAGNPVSASAGVTDPSNPY